MALYLSDDDYSSEDEVFIGPITLKDIKKRFLPKQKKHRQTVGCPAVTKHEENCEESLKLIEVHSTPNILANKEEYKPVPKIILTPEVDSSWDLKPNDSFLQIAKMVSDLCVKTIDTIEQISKEPHTEVLPDIPKTVIPSTAPDTRDIIEKKSKEPQTEVSHDIPNIVTPSTATEEPKQNNHVPFIDNQKPNFDSPNKKDKSIHLMPEENSTEKDYLTPTKQKVPDILLYSTPDSRVQTPVFKTPGVPVSQRKLLTPCTKKSFQHVVSPVAAYINNSPVVPLVRDVRPKKPLTSFSAIPKPVKSASKIPVHNKENNIKLPHIAYKAAKQTKMINIPNEEKMPENQWAKQIASSIPRATVIRHDHREGNLKKPLKQQSEDSFGDLSLHQAEVSVCVKKSACNKAKK